MYENRQSQKERDQLSIQHKHDQSENNIFENQGLVVMLKQVCSTSLPMNSTLGPDKTPRQTSHEHFTSS